MNDLNQQLKDQRASLAEQERLREQEAKNDAAERARLEAREKDRLAAEAKHAEELKLLERKEAWVKEGAALGMDLTAAPASGPVGDDSITPSEATRHVQHYTFNAKLEALLHILGGCKFKDMRKESPAYELKPKTQWGHIGKKRIGGVEHTIILITPFYKSLHLGYLWSILMLRMLSRLPDPLRLVQYDAVNELWIVTARGQAMLAMDKDTKLGHIRMLSAMHTRIYKETPKGDPNHYKKKEIAMDAADALPMSEAGIRKAYHDLGVPYPKPTPTAGVGLGGTVQNVQAVMQ